MLNLDWRYHERQASLGKIAAADFPQRREFADLPAAQARLSAALDGVRRVTRCDIANVRYTPGKRFLVVYRYGEGALDLLTVDFAPPGEGRSRYAAAVADGLGPEELVFIGDGWDSPAWVFPADPRGLAMAPLLSGDTAAGRAVRAVGRDPGHAEPQISVLSYLPGERCAVRYSWTGCEASVVGKLQPGIAASHRFMFDLWQLPGRQFRMARPLACDETTGVRWEQFSRGERIDRSDGSLVEKLQVLAGGLARLHAVVRPGLPHREAGDVLSRIERKVLPRVVGAMPEFTVESRALVNALASWAGSLPARPAATLHGDLHTGNVLFDDGEAVFIDLDSLALGDPAYDLALIATRLLLGELIAGDGSRQQAQAAAELPRLYVEAGGTPVPHEVYAWYVATLLLGRQIKTCVNHHAPDLERMSRTMLSWASALAATRRYDPAYLPTA